VLGGVAFANALSSIPIRKSTGASQSVALACASGWVEIWQSGVGSTAVGARSSRTVTSSDKLIALACAGASIEVGCGTSASVLSGVAFATALSSIPIRKSTRAGQSVALACASGGVEIWQS